MSTDERPPVEIMRVPISLPCSVPVVPDSPDHTAPLAERTEVCAIDAWNIVGIAPMCDHHVRAVMGEDEWLRFTGTLGLHHEIRPWADCHRYDQASTRRGLDPRHPLALSREAVPHIGVARSGVRDFLDGLLARIDAEIGDGT